MVGRTLAQYRIEEKLGKGGMGDVYRAFDSRLKRDVAIKILNRSEQREDELARLLGEARAAAPLNHPAIATIHEVGEDEGVSFIVMELVTGGTLREAFAGEACEPRTLCRIGMEIAGGLQAAHGNGVIHGDIKPDNLMVGPDDRIKILDFGVARRLSMESVDATLSIGDVHWTQPGKISGTLAYMAPEQLRGERIDGRADLYSLGVVLYELATGSRPYDGDSVTALMAKVLSESVVPLADLERNQPAELVRIVGKLLAKDVRERYPSARDVATDLKNFLYSTEPGKNAVVDSRRSVAVLPFPLLSGGAEDEFLSVALAEVVSHGLSQNTELVVRPTSAVMRYAAREVDPLLAARELNVQVVVEGSIQRLGPQVRVQAQAWEAPQGSTLLSVKLDGQMTELFDLQDRLADALAHGLGLDESGSTAAPPTANPRAYELYLRASERLLRYTRHETREAIDMLQTAVSVDARFSAAWARLANAAVTMAVFFDASPQWYGLADQAVGRTLKLDPANAEAWTARGRMLWSPQHGFLHAEALRNLRKAHHLPSPPHDAPLWEGLVLLHIGLHDEARSCLLEALEEQPDDLIAMLSLGELASYEGNDAKALEYFDRTLALDPSHLYGNMFVLTGQVYMGDLDRAEKTIVRAREVVGEDSLIQSVEAIVWAKRGETERSEEVIRRATEDLQSLSHAHHTRHYIAAALATMGQPERAVEQLRLAAQSGLPNYPLFLRDRHFDPLRTRADFNEFLADLKPGWEAFRSEFGRGGGR